MKARIRVAQRTNRQKLSTTVSAETYDFLQHMVKRGQAATVAEALDQLVRRVRCVENRVRLAAATAEYFEQSGPQAAAEEHALARDLSSSVGATDFDHEI
jgi:hypothetical protein